MSDTEDLLIELLTRLTLAVESIADAIASHAEAFVAANDEGRGMSDIEILHAITGLVDQIEDNELRTGMQFIIGSIGLTFASDAEAQQSRIDLLIQWVQQDCPWDKEVILECIERERMEA